MDSYDTLDSHNEVSTLISSSHAERVAFGGKS